MSISSTLNTTVQTAILKTSNLKGPPAAPRLHIWRKAAYWLHHAQRSKRCYLLVELEKLHRHIALKLGPGPAGKHPQSSDDHRVEDLEIQGDGRRIREGKHRGVRHRHNLYVFILACHWDRGMVEITAQAHVKFITMPTRQPSLFTVMKTEWFGGVLREEERLW